MANWLKWTISLTVSGVLSFVISYRLSQFIEYMLLNLDPKRSADIISFFVFLFLFIKIGDWILGWLRKKYPN